jgi:putative transposase
MAHARRYHRHDGTSGHAWQGWFKEFIVQDDDHLRTALRYVERNALRAELVARAEDWKWSSLPGWLRRDPLLWRGGLKVRDKLWLARVNEPLSDGDLQRLRLSVERGRPFGTEPWTRETARRLGARVDTAIKRVAAKRRGHKFVMSPFPPFPLDRPKHDNR